ncbi:signal peptidase II [Paucilactobacillus hokkaidonensis JCM 18461]|uniref:Lipoprotein signal peptidase n=2 Tax=Paucilactobacillus hokkaidonensis TaxID=1193095 RepID=A0A0A1GUK9_9LACO|nr:signal peptidase II [Paucilactobacillus hokkaidonensis]KRO10643.1 lipoprotein signal peptidase [Paucilactobacillus hokkaidonensis]BAP85635.1 signal peptidase II [Paucilactobacillus hokkaidonensis JCM 18461]
MPYYLALMIVLVLSDQILKHWITVHIALDAVSRLVPSVLSLTNLRNSGAAWSILEGQQWFFTIISLLAVGFVGYYLWRFRHSFWYALPLTFILAGTFGNFIDRLRFGYVVDMFQLDFINFPIFNLADTFLTIGVLVLIVVIWREGEHENA